MSTSIYFIYKRALVSNYGLLYHPNWEPTRAHQLGDFGTMLQGQFTRVGNVRELGIAIIASRSPVQAHQTFSSGANVSYDFSGGAQASLKTAARAKAKLRVAFSGGQGISINAYGLQHTQIQNYQAIAAAVLHLQHARQWNERWVVVTELHQAHRCILAISSEGTADAEIEFEARQKLPVATLTMTDANLGLVCKNQRNIGYTLDSQQGVVTLGMGLGKVDVPLLRTPRFNQFENRGRWGSDGPTTKFETGRSWSTHIHLPDALESGTPRFVRVSVS